MALSISCTCCALVSTSAGRCRYLCYPSAVMRLWPLVIKPCALIPDLVHMRHTLVPRCCVIRHMVLIALICGKILWLPLRSYRLYNRISQFQFDRPLWPNPVPSSLIRCTCIVPLFLRCCVICHMVLIAQCGKVLRLPLRSYCLYNRISQFQFDNISPRKTFW